MTIAQIDPLNVDVFIPVALYGSIKACRDAAVGGAAPVGGRCTAKAEVIDPLIDAKSDAFSVRLLLPYPNNKIPAGLRCRWNSFGNAVTANPSADNIYRRDG